MIRPPGILRTPKLSQEAVLGLISGLQNGNRKQRRAIAVQLRRYNKLISKVRTLAKKIKPEDLTSQVLGDTVTLEDIENEAE